MSEKKLQEWQETTTIWHRITDLPEQTIPDADITVQVYDSELEDVVFVQRIENQCSIHWYFM